jgi:hypothetical protein
MFAGKLIVYLMLSEESGFAILFERSSVYLIPGRDSKLPTSIRGVSPLILLYGFVRSCILDSLIGKRLLLALSKAALESLFFAVA